MRKVAIGVRIHVVLFDELFHTGHGIGFEHESVLRSDKGRAGRLREHTELGALCCLVDIQNIGYELARGTRKRRAYDILISPFALVLDEVTPGVDIAVDEIPEMREGTEPVLPKRPETQQIHPAPGATFAVTHEAYDAQQHGEIRQFAVFVDTRHP